METNIEQPLKVPEIIFNGTPKAQALEAWKRLTVDLIHPAHSRRHIGDDMGIIDSYLETSFEFTESGLRSALSRTKKGKKQAPKAAEASRVNGTKPAAPGKRRGRPYKDPEKQAQAVAAYQEKLKAEAEAAAKEASDRG